MRSKKHILIINDNLKLLNQLVRHLSEEGYIVDSTEFGKKGVKRFKDRKFDLVLIDYHLDNDKPKTAEFFINKMKIINSLIPIIVISATEVNLSASVLNASDFVYLDLGKNFMEEISKHVKKNLVK